MSTMTLEQVRDWHATCADTFEYNGESALADQHRKLAAAIAAHLAQPAQAVDVVAWRWRDNVRPGLPWKTTTGAEVIRQMEASGGYEIEPLTRALSGEKAGPVGDGWSAWHDKEARTWGVRSPSGDCCEVHERAGGPHAEVLRQLAQDLPASPAPDKEQA